MKLAQFEYDVPGTLDEALGILDSAEGTVKPLAGGQSLIPVLAFRATSVDRLVDLRRVRELCGIERLETTLRIGAMTTQSAVERAGTPIEDLPILSYALFHVGHFQIRNRGTIGGSIAHADPAAELPAVALALDATINVASRSGSRRIAARDFFESTWATALAPNELLVSIEFPLPRPRTGFAVEEVARRHGDFALAGAVAAVRLGRDETIVDASVALFGVGWTPVRAPVVEEALLGADATNLRLGEVGSLASAGLQPADDALATGQYRRSAVTWAVERAVANAFKRAEAGVA